MAERAGRPEVGDAELLLQREAGGHHLPEHARHVLAGERARVLGDEPAEHLRLPLGPPGRPAGAGLELADRLRVAGPLVQPREHLAVEAIDRLAMAGEFGVAIAVAHCASLYRASRRASALVAATARDCLGALTGASSDCAIVERGPRSPGDGLD